MSINIGGGELKELKPRILVLGVGGAGGNAINAMIDAGMKGATAVDFRAKNDKNFENLKKNSIDFYAATKSLYLQNKKRQINNSTSSQDEDWGNLDN